MNLDLDRVLEERPPSRITEGDWIRPLVMLRNIAAQKGVTLTDAQEQAICREATEALTSALADEIEARGTVQ